ncbi:MAG: DUF2079 domain-containing protein [Nocardioidaceae bacterium]
MVAVHGRPDRPTAEVLETRRRDAVDWRRRAPYLLAAAFGVVYATVSLARLHRQASMSWDVAIFEQAISGYARLGAPIADVKGPGYDVLGLHFSPALAVFAPFYRLFPEPTTLLVGQALLVAVSVAVIARAAIRYVGPAGGLAIGVAYGLSWGIQSGINFDFHEVCLAMPLLALAGAAYLARDWPMVAVWSLPLLLVKEDFGLTVAALGGCLLICGARRWGIGLLLSGVIGFVVTVFVLIPMANPAGSSEFWNSYGSDGGVGGVFERILSMPEQFVSPGVKIETLLLLLAITGGLALRSPYILVAVPTVMWRFLSDNPAYWGTEWHYSMPLMPILFVALIDGIRRAREDEWRWWLRTYAMHVPTVAVTVALVLSLQFPFRDLVRPETYDAAPRAAVAEQVMDLIPDGTSVESDLGLLTQLAGDHTVYWLGSDNSAVTPDYVLIDAWSGWQGRPPDVAEHAMALHPGTTYEVIFDRDGYQLARHIG